MRRSVLVKVPSFSRLGLAGNTTSAKTARVTEENILRDEELEFGKAVSDKVA